MLYNKAIYNKSIANIILNRENLKAFLLKPGMRQKCPLSPLLFNTVLESLVKGIRQDKNKKKEVKLCLFADSMILYLKDPKDSTKNFNLIHNFNRLAGHKTNIQKSKAFLYTNNKKKTRNKT
jgi:hypothetical protein